MFFAGIYRPSKDDIEKPEVSIVTTGANKPMEKVHDRMPVILGSQNAAMAWLREDDKNSLDELMQPAVYNALKGDTITVLISTSPYASFTCVLRRVNQHVTPQTNSSEVIARLSK